MMLTLLYHRVGDGKYANPLPILEKHLTWIASHARVIWPGEALKRFHLNVCLTFDDATFDFYYYVFPLLKRLGLRAILAVPAGLIQDQSDLDPALRLSVPYSQAMKDETARTHVPFCTWTELREMVQSGYVQIASHSFSHQNMLLDNLDLDQEIQGSKRLLEEKLQTSVSTFVYPMGKFNRAVHQLVKQHYSFAMRIGSACNTSWQNLSQITYRVDCDRLASIEEPFCFRKKITYCWFYLLNSLRRR